MKYCLAALFLMSINSLAAVYMEQTPSGNITYSDTPSTHATRIEIEERNAVTSSKITPAAKKPVMMEIKPTYSVFAIHSPKNQETIQNQPSITVSLQIEPTLLQGHHIQIYVDDKPQGLPQAATTFNIGRLERGTHQIYASIIDKQKRNIRQSPIITIYVQQVHAANPLVRKPQ